MIIQFLVWMTQCSYVDDRRDDPDFGACVNVDASDRPATRSHVQMLNPFSSLQSSFAFCSITDALKSSERENCKNAMSDEMESLMENRTWDLVPLPNGRKALNGKQN